LLRGLWRYLGLSGTYDPNAGRKPNVVGIKTWFHSKNSSHFEVDKLSIYSNIRLCGQASSLCQSHWVSLANIRWNTGYFPWLQGPG